MPCMARFKHQCSQFQGVEPAHSDHHDFGRGAGHKSHDWAFAAVCHNAHLEFDKMDRGLKFMEWVRTYSHTQTYLWENGLITLGKP